MRSSAGWRAWFLGCLGLGLTAAYAQNPGQRPTPRPGGNPTQPGRRSDPNEMDGARLVNAVFGKVSLDDGTAPPEPALIELTCASRTRLETYSDNSGRFTINLGQTPDSPANSTTPGRGATPLNPNARPQEFQDLSNCGVRASLAGYRSTLVTLHRNTMDSGLLVLRPLANVAGSAISMTTLAAPKDAKSAYQKAQRLLGQKPPHRAEAVKQIEKAVQLYPAYAVAWNLLGETRLALQDDDGARDAFERSLAADSKYTSPYLQLAALDLRAQRWAPAAELSGRLISLNPYIAQAQSFHAVAHLNLGHFAVAEKAARAAADNDKVRRMPYLIHLLGVIQGREGKFEEAAANYRLYLQADPQTPEAEQARRQLAEWQDLGVIAREDANQNRC